jgi:hypothetical protein
LLANLQRLIDAPDEETPLVKFLCSFFMQK